MKKKTSENGGRLTPKQYLQQKAKALPFYELLINDTWQEARMAQLWVSKLQPSGKLVVGFFLIDFVENGLKDAFYRLPVTIEEYQDVLPETITFVKIDSHLAHNIIYGAVDFSEEQGYALPRDFAIMENLLDDTQITDGIDDLPFGDWAVYDEDEEAGIE
ncbi:MAG: hypothetical protein ACOVQA_04585 [Thermoflexibacteraceae bacterium]